MVLAAVVVAGFQWTRGARLRGKRPRRTLVGWSGRSRGWRGAAHRYRAVHDGGSGGGGRRWAAGETSDVGDVVVIEGLWDSVMFVDGWSGLEDDWWKMAPVVACSEEGGGVRWPWQLRAGVSMACGWGSSWWQLRHSTWLHVSDGLPVHNGAGAEVEQCWGVGAKMVERGRPSDLCALFISMRGGWKRWRELRPGRWQRWNWGRQSGGCEFFGLAKRRQPLSKCWRHGWVPMFG
jgi:hypothetical protein